MIIYAISYYEQTFLLQTFSFFTWSLLLSSLLPLLVQQEHHFEISTRAIAYVDLSRILRGNQTLTVYSSPLLREIARKAIARVKHAEMDSSTTSSATGSAAGKSNGSPIYFSSVVRPDEPSFAFFGNLGIPFIRICVSNSPKVEKHIFTYLPHFSLLSPRHCVCTHTLLVIQHFFILLHKPSCISAVN